jgi:predicted enzyme related to lactoylglutathione lyase
LYSISHEEIKRDGNGEREMPTIVHFDIPSDDIERSKKFYNELFGWKFDKWSGSEAMPEGMEYWMVTTVDDKGNEAVTGGMMKRQMPQQQGITNFFDVKSVQEYSAKVEQLGGKVISPKHPVPGMVILQYAQIQRIMALVFGKRIILLNE